ncbi:MAG: hypothetical protein AAB845_01680, partial [Patescibacteria group bacterium]
FGAYFPNGAFEFTCDISSNAGTASATNFGAGAGSVGGLSGGGVGFSGSGSCQAVTNSTSNPCSTSNLANTCFGGSRVDTWSAICQAESSGSTTIASRTDVCTGDGSPVSFGLFQINISANKVGGLNCPTAFNRPFTGSSKNCSVVNRNLYNQCVAAAKTASQNIATACSLSSNGTNTGPWGAARKCSIPVKI